MILKSQHCKTSLPGRQINKSFGIVSFTALLFMIKDNQAFKHTGKHFKEKETQRFRVNSILFYKVKDTDCLVQCFHIRSRANQVMCSYRTNTTDVTTPVPKKLRKLWHRICVSDLISTIASVFRFFQCTEMLAPNHVSVQRVSLQNQSLKLFSQGRKTTSTLQP